MSTPLANLSIQKDEFEAVGFHENLLHTIK